MGKKAACCVCSAMAALLMATTVFVVPAAADVGGSRDASEDVRVVRVAFPEVEGISETDADGVRSGILYDWLAEVSKYTGWTYEFVDGDVQGLMKRTSAGEIDLMGGMYYREQLVDSFQYSNFAIGANHALLISLEENDDVVVFDSRTLNGKTIGVFENATEKIRRLENYLDFNDIHCIVLPLDYDAYSKCLDDGTADVVLGGDVDVTEGRRVAAEFDGEPYYIAMPFGSDLKDDLDAAMTSIYTANAEFANELDAKHLPSRRQSAIKFSEADRAFIDNAGEISVAVMQGRYPLYYERDGLYQGIEKDVLDLVTERTGLAFRLVHASTYQDAVDLVKSGEVDMMGGFLDDGYAADGQQLAITESFASLNEVVFRNKLASSGETVFAQIEGRDGTDGVEASEVVHYRTYEDCLEAVNSGRADATSMPVAFAEGLFIDHSFSNITPATSEHHEAGLSFALAKPVDTELYSIMSKAVNSFSQDELDTIASHNSMPSFGKQRTIQALVSENPLLVVALSLVLCLFVGAIVIVVSVAKVRNRMMEMKLEKVEEMGRAKTDFLSRMSHEIRTPMNAIIGLSSVASLSGEATPSIRSSLEKINMSAQFLLSLVNDILDMSKIENDKMRIETAPLRLRSLAERLQSMFFLQAEDKGVLLETRCDADDVVVGDDVRLQQVLANLLSNALKFTDPGDAIRLSVVVLMRDEGSARALQRGRYRRGHPRGGSRAHFRVVRAGVRESPQRAGDGSRPGYQQQPRTTHGRKAGRAEPRRRGFGVLLRAGAADGRRGGFGGRGDPCGNGRPVACGHARAACRRQRSERRDRRGAARHAGRRGAACGERARSRGHVRRFGAGSVRFRVDGREDAVARRPRGGDRDPRARSERRSHGAHHRAHGQHVPGGPRGRGRCRDGRLHPQALRCPAALRDAAQLPAAQGVGSRLRRKFTNLAKPAQASYSSAR